jgi:arachidonate 15-lipoxygenase
LITRLRWRARRWFWNRFALFKYDHNRPDTVPVPVPDRPLVLVSLASQYRHIPIQRVLVADRVPADERQTVKRLFSRLQAVLYRIVPPQQRGLPAVDADARAALGAAYTPAHRQRFPAPLRPAELAWRPARGPARGPKGPDPDRGEPEGPQAGQSRQNVPDPDLEGPDLGALAVASPFACYVTMGGDGTFTWDLRVLEAFEHQPGLRSLGAVVSFETGAGGGGLAAVRIDSDAGSCTPSDREWPLASRLAMSAASTHLSIVRHFAWIHLAAGGPLAVVTRNELPPDHPLRRLLWPHVYATQYSNDLITEDQLAPGGDFEGMFSLTHRGVCALIDASIDGFDFGTIDPDVDALSRGLGGLATPSIENRRQHHAVFLAHARRYLERYYDDDGITADESVRAWEGELARRVSGIGRVTASAVGVESVARLAAAIMQLAAVEHEILGSGMWDYQLWTDAVPARVPADGTRPPLDVYQRLVNANFNLNVHRTALLSDFSGLALNAAGAEAFRTFRADLLALQSEFDASPSEPWRMEPKRLKANINA